MVQYLQIVGWRNTERIKFAIAVLEEVWIRKSVALNPTRQCRFVMNGSPSDGVVLAAGHGNANGEGEAVLESKLEAFEQASTFICIW
jgi:hypothetical protein